MLVMYHTVAPSPLPVVLRHTVHSGERRASPALTRNMSKVWACLKGRTADSSREKSPFWSTSSESREVLVSAAGHCSTRSASSHTDRNNTWRSLHHSTEKFKVLSSCPL